MLARNADCDAVVVGLIGERGREVQEFLQDDLGEEGLARSVVVVATSDEPALMRRQAAYLTLTIAEFFRDLPRVIRRRYSLNCCGSSSAPAPAPTRAPSHVSSA